jgi:prepilin-type N-terminal cleavage/methylation domain-containing protein
MRKTRAKSGLTLLEMLTVVVIVAVLAAMVIGLTGRFEQRSKEGQVRATFSTLDAALEQFADYRFRYKDSDYEDFRFPLDCNGFDKLNVETTLGEALDETVIIINSGSIEEQEDYSGIEVMYFLLSRVPEGRKTLERINRSLVLSNNADDTTRFITIGVGLDQRKYTLFRIIDPWGGVLRYDYYDEKESVIKRFESRRTFPVITSAGPDRVFDTDDDISSREF